MESRLSELKRYVSFSAEDAARLRRFRNVAAPDFVRIAQEFYERIREHEDAHAVLSNDEQVTRLQTSLVKWMERVCSGQYDETYFEETARIGRVHVHVGLPVRYMPTAISVIRAAFERIAVKMGAEAEATRGSIERVLDIDLAIMLDAYQTDFAERARRVERWEQNPAAHDEYRRYAAAVELAHVMFIGMDGEGAIRLFNRESERVFGFARDEVLEQNFSKTLLMADSVAQFADALGRVSTAPLNIGVRTRSGKRREIRVRLSHIEANQTQDHNVNVFLVGTDTTDEVALAERTRRAEKLATVGALAAGLAHEIRNPLNGAQLHVTYLSRALKQMNATKDVMDALGVVGDEIHRLADLVTDFLAFAQPRPLADDRVSLQALCQRVSKLVSQRAHDAKTTLETELPLRNIEIDADGARLEQVLLNLTHNAIDAAANREGAKVILRVLRYPHEVRLEVEDNGPGLTNPDAPIFDPFFTTKRDGTGLGLAIVHRIVTDHHGSVSVDRHPGRTIFRVSLPIVRSAGETS